MLCLREQVDLPLLLRGRLLHLVHLVLRNALDGCGDPVVLRAAELFFRPQRVSLHEGRVLLADAEVIEAHEGGPEAPWVTALFFVGFLLLLLLEDMTA